MNENNLKSLFILNRMPALIVEPNFTGEKCFHREREELILKPCCRLPPVQEQQFKVRKIQQKMFPMSALKPQEKIQ